MSRDEKYADLAAAEKIARGTARRVFTRSKNALTTLIHRRTKASELLVAWNVLVECFSDLEKANTSYLVVAEIDIDENQKEAAYLDQPHQDLSDALFTYGEFMERKEESKKVSEAPERRLESNS